MTNIRDKNGYCPLVFRAAKASIYRGGKNIFIEQKISCSDRGGGPPSE